MNSAMWPVLKVLVCCLLVVTDAAPWRNYEVRQSQACGDKLADILSLVCSGRGYNFALKPESSSARRFRRGIVDECCRRSCTPAMLELYCRADPTEDPTNVQIRKRSDSGMESTEQRQVGDATKLSSSTVEAQTQKIALQENVIESKDSVASTTTKKEGDNIYKQIDLLASSSSDHSTYKHDTRNTINKPTPNDTTEEFYRQSNIPLLRHHKNHHHNHSRRQFRRKASAKTKREKNVHGESTQTFQIGTVKPYFAGRALASLRSHHTPLS